MARDKLKKSIADKIRRSSPEFKAKRSIQRRAAHAIKCAAEGKVVRKWRYTAEELKASRKASYAKWKQKNLDKARASDAKRHKEIRATEEGLRKSKISAANYRKTHKEKIRNDYAVWREKNIDSVLAYNKKHYAENKELFFAHNRNRRARIKGNGGTHTAADIRALWFEQKGKCGLCELPMDEKKYHVDHWKPLSKGGSNGKENLKLLHPKCNLMKYDRLPEELKLRIVS